MSKEFDIILMGATSFVGKITARRFVEQFSRQPNSIRIAFAGRSMQKLTHLSASLSQDFPEVNVPLLQAESMSDEAMAELAKKTRVIISTVGPYDLYGEALVKACAESGTHYCDLTGEPQFIHRMLTKYESTANASGACIVHCCGFDSIPSDIGTYYLQQQSREKYAAPAVDVDMRVKALSGGVSGGTIASLMNVIADVRRNPGLKKVLFNPYALCPQQKDVKQTYVGKAQPDWATDQWIAPFVMAAVNSKVVMRSSQQLTGLYPDAFRYNEAMLGGGLGSKSRRKAKTISFGLTALTIGAALAPTRWLLQRFVLPKPGEGPSETEQEAGFFILNFYGRTASGQKMAVQVRGDQDPGYGSTSKMLSQAALALAFDLPADQAGGFWTPASLLGEQLLKRLAENAGFEFNIL